MRGFSRRKALAEPVKIAFSLSENDVQPDSMFILNKRVGLSQLVNDTKFTAKELKSLYRNFKTTTPSALISRELFRNIFNEFFRRGDVECYSDLVFNAINTSRSGFITFVEFTRTLSVLCRGSMEERIEWIYRLYDPMRTNLVSWQNFLHLITAVDDLVEISRRQNCTPEQNIKRAQELFLKFNPNINDVVTKEDFIRICQEDSSICESITALHSVILFKF